VLSKDTEPAEVVVLSTLHQLHAQTKGYSFEDLAAVIEQLRPDILAVELTPTDLASRRDQSNKQEYPRSVFPLLDKHDYRVVALEPGEPKYSDIVQMFRRGQTELREQSPEKAELFNVYVSTLFEYLSEYWESPATVNSQVSNMIFESKHRFQNEVFGPTESAAWEAWNQHFLEQIVEAAESSPGMRIVVLVGAEHAYWLRAHLQNDDINLLDAEGMLEQLPR
jgi:hypothetical protein